MAMNTSLRMLAAAAALLILAGCNRQGPEVPRAVDDNAAADGYGEGVQPVVVNPDAAKVGAAVDAQGAISEPASEFGVGQTVYISVPTKFGRKAGDRLEIFWFHDDGRSRKDDRKVIAGPNTVFELIAKDSGAYNVEVDANGRPIALAQFTIK
jgi:predicted small lipoprotein YifL